jgi:hypothetical protein
MSETPDSSTPVPAPQPAPAAAAPAVLPPENRLRGTLLALLIIPAGIIVWVLIAAIGFISGWVGIGVAVGALALYRFGSGGRISYNGAIRVSLIVVFTIVVSYLAGFVAGNPAYFARAFQSGKFFEGIAATMGRGGGDTTINVLLVLAFAVIGVVLVFRTAATQAKADQVAGATPTAGTLPPQA